MLGVRRDIHQTGNGRPNLRAILAQVPASSPDLLPFVHITPKAGDHFKARVTPTTLRAAADTFSEEQMGFDEFVFWAQEWDHLGRTTSRS